METLSSRIALNGAGRPHKLPGRRSKGCERGLSCRYKCLFASV